MQADGTTINSPKKIKKMIAKTYFSGFEGAIETYNAISEASDGRIYYVLCSTRHDVAAQLHVYDPKTDATEFLADLSEVVGEKQQNYISQGKSHTEFYEVDQKLYFATHVGFYEMIDGAQNMPVNPPKGYKLYPGGHFVYYDMKTKEVKSMAKDPNAEGILAMTMDVDRKQMYAITWPTGYLLHYDVEKDVLRNLGPVSGPGEAGKRGDDYRVLCRSLLVNPNNGLVYYSTSDGNIFEYDPSTGAVPRMLKEVNLRLDYFGKFDPRDAGSMGYNWRKIQWYGPENKAYGVHGNSGYLFTFDPENEKIEIVDRITSEPSKKSGMNDQFSYGYLGYKIKGDMIYYLTGAPIYKDGKRVAGVDKINMGAPKGLEHLHLVTFHIPTRTYKDLGAVFYEDGSFPTYVNSIAVGDDNDVYTVARFNHEGKTIDDLIKVKIK